MNAMGFHLLFVGLEYRNEATSMQKIETERYDHNQTVTIQFPISVPYMPSSATFERVEGKFQYKGEFYRLVKQKYANDTLTIICIRDIETKRIHTALSDYVKTFSDDMTTDQQNKTSLSFSFSKDYLQSFCSIKHFTAGWQSDVMFDLTSSGLIPAYTASIIHPPERG
jgi:hypothetical protein